MDTDVFQYVNGGGTVQMGNVDDVSIDMTHKMGEIPTNTGIPPSVLTAQSLASKTFLYMRTANPDLSHNSLPLLCIDRFTLSDDSSGANSVLRDANTVSLGIFVTVTGSVTNPK